MRFNSSVAPTDYEALAELRYQIRRFLRFSEQVAREAGLEPRQHQLMLALKGIPKGVRPKIGEVAERLQIQHHSTVELVNRLAERGFVKRQRGGTDRREVLLSLTPKGEKVLRDLSLHHREELRDEGPALVSALMRVMGSKAVRSIKSARATNSASRGNGIEHVRQSRKSSRER